MGFNADIKRAREDCLFFGERYFKHLLTAKSPPFHEELVRLAADDSTDRVSILAPRGHAKSTWLSIIYPIWKIANNRDIRIIIVSDTQEQADMFLGGIRSELEANEGLVGDFGAFRRKRGKGGASPGEWRGRAITVDRPSRLKEPTIFSAGTRSRIIGRRADLIIVDDPINSQDVLKKGGRASTLRWFRKTLSPILVPTGRMVVIGTRKHRNDLHSELGKNPRFTQHIFRALEGDRPLWPEMWPAERLLGMKSEIGALAFAQEYQNEPVGEDTSYFRREWIDRCMDNTSTLLRHYSGERPVFSGWDLSILPDRERAEENDTDYTAGITLALGLDGTRHIIGIFRERGLSPAKVMEEIESVWKRFSPSLVTVEDNLFQSLYPMSLAERSDMPVRGHTTSKGKMDLRMGVPSLAVKFENAKYRIPCGDSDSSRLANEFADELTGFGWERHDDMVMALWMAECGISRWKSMEGILEVIDDPS